MNRRGEGGAMGGWDRSEGRVPAERMVAACEGALGGITVRSAIKAAAFEATDTNRPPNVAQINGIRTPYRAYLWSTLYGASHRPKTPALLACAEIFWPKITTIWYEP